jgi:hypothetical protein
MSVKWMVMMASMSVLTLSACMTEVEPEEEVLPVDEPAAEEQYIVGSGSCAYYVPPRCGPRNCVAMCATCFYDFCRGSGGSCSSCKAQMEACKDECYEGTPCPPSDPFCDF